MLGITTTLCGECDEVPAVFGRLAGVERVANPDVWCEYHHVVSNYVFANHPTHRSTHNMRITRRKKLFIAGITAVGLMGGSALAYWTTTGSGSGSANVGTSTTVTVAQLGTITGLTPGSAAQPVDFRITNSATTNQTITSVAVSIASVTGGSNLPNACTAADFTLVQPSATYGDLTPGIHNYQPSGASLALDNTASNQDGCKNATVTLAFAAS
jgi:hypothetical protein